MSLRTALTHRVAQWCQTLYQYGYIVEIVEVHDRAGTLWIRAKRPALHGGPPTTLHVWEIWLAGMDQDDIGPIVDDCYLHHCSWHAQTGGDRDIDAERLDIDRSKPSPLIRHRHPYGRPNAHREPTKLSTPEAWVAHVEAIVASLYPPADGRQKA